MRFAGLLLLIAAVVAALAASAGAGTSARATATLVAGTSGTHGSVTLTRGHEFRSLSVTAPGVRIERGELSLRAAGASARASAGARTVSLLDGLVTAYGVRREIESTGKVTSYQGRVAGLRIGERQIGDVTEAATYELPDGGGTVVVNTGDAGLVLTLDRPYGDQPAGTRIAIAEVSAGVRATAGRPAATATPEQTATPDPERRSRRHRKARSAKAKARAAARQAARHRLITGPFVFPVFGTASFSDDFGAPRQIGAHQGNDVFAPFGAPVVAVADGVVEKVGTLPISGNRLWIRADTGDTFFYAHLSSFAPAAVNGRRVKAGALLGFVGNTGDAEPTPPHVHFEIHPGDGSATDPLKILTAWQSNPSPSARALARYGSTAEEPGALVEIRDFIAG